MTREELNEVLTWTCIGAFALAFVVPAFFRTKEPSISPILGSKGALNRLYKRCFVLHSRGEKDLSLKSLEINTSKYWHVVDADSRVSPDLDLACFEAHLLAIPTASYESYEQLAYGLNLENGQKSCITRGGDKRDDWSCE